MSIYHFYFYLFFSSLSLVFSDHDYYQSRACCTFKGPDYEDIEYTIMLSFNKNFMMEFNSTRGNWTGFTPYSMDVAKHTNNPIEKAIREFEKKILCLDNRNAIRSIVNQIAAPTIKMKSVKQSAGGHPAMLVCSAFNFYPKQIRMTWLRNQKQVTAGVSYSEVMPDGDWLYQTQSYLEYTPAHGEKITCVVEHTSLPEPALVVWDPSLPVAERNKIVIGLCGLLLGFVAVISGLIYYKKTSASYTVFCHRRVLVPVKQLPAEGAT